MSRNPDIDRISLDKRIEALASSGGGGGGGGGAGGAPGNLDGFFPFYNAERWYSSSENGAPAYQSETGGYSQDVVYDTSDHTGNIFSMRVNHLLYYPTIKGFVCGPTAWAMQIRVDYSTSFSENRAYNVAKFPVRSTARQFITAFALTNNNYPKPILAEMRNINLAYSTQSTDNHPTTLGPGVLNVKIYYERSSDSVVYDMEIVNLPSNRTTTDAFAIGGVFFRTPTMGGAPWILDSTVNILGGFPESSNGYFRKYGAPGIPQRLLPYIPRFWG